MKLKRLYLVLAVVVLALLAGCQPLVVPAEDGAAPAATDAPAEEAATGDAQKLILATTTSTDDSGLLDYILPVFEEEANVDVEVIAVGTGQALQLGMDGNADVLLVHARAREDAFMDEGHGVRREDVMYNDFVIVGPPDDPAGISGMTDAAAAFAQAKEESQLDLWSEMLHFLADVVRDADMQAVLVNPFDIDGMRTSLIRACRMPDREQRQRMRSLGRTVRAHDLYAWAARFLGALSEDTH